MDLIYYVQMKRFLKVLCAIKMTHAAARQKLRGVYRYVAEGHDWDIRLIREEHGLTGRTIRQAAADTDGFLISIPNATEALSALSRVRAPVAAIECDHPFLARRKHPTVLLGTDNAAIGRMAASYFHSLGRFGSFAFIHDASRSYWSEDRRKGFFSALKGDRAVEFAGTAQGLRSFERWLAHAPHPIAAFCAWDTTAIDVLTRIRHVGLSVPEQVSVMGVDDDECLCDTANPPLTSIRVNREQQGYDAAAMLGRMMEGPCRIKTRQILCKPLRIVERKSTRSLTPARFLVDRALLFIANHACEGITPNSVALELGVSRRLLDLRFHDLHAGTIQDNITQTRFSHVLALARTSLLPIESIAQKTGFPNANALRNLFRAKTGASLTVWRRKHTSSLMPLE